MAKTRGRPRKAGPRKPCGRLVQKVAPNERVVELRRAILGDARADLSTAEDPMTLALVRGWITEDQHRAGVTYAIAYRRSHPQRRIAASIQETPDRHYDPRPIGQMGSAEIAAAFDQLMAGTRHAAMSEDSEIQARQRYNRMSFAMRPDEQNEVFLCFCLASWPQWIVQRAAGHYDTAWERKYRLLVSGLIGLTQHLAPVRKAS